MIVQELMQHQRYELVRILAEGSYGKVLLARDTSNQQDLAFKVFTMEVNEGEDGVDDEDDSNLKGRRKFTEDEEEIKGHV
jgi:serine/threonine protein kinase